ncbi:hypothetical protein [Caldanaerobacter sp.]|uniref:hypothetical protein n=1 Tax=Caldanaerobacter sp. TaxID=2930036 RepID=UPI003C734D3F
MKRYLLFLSVLFIFSSLLTSCAVSDDTFKKLEKYHFTANSDPTIIYATSDRVLLRDKGELVLEYRGNFYKLPVSIDDSKDGFITAVTENIVIAGKIENGRIESLHLIDVISGKRMELKEEVLKYLDAPFYSTKFSNDNYFAYINQPRIDKVINVIDLKNFREFTVDVNTPVYYAVALKENSGYAIYFENSDGIYRKIASTPPEKFTYGHLIDANNEGIVYIYRTEGSITKVYKVQKDKNIKEIAEINGRIFPLRKDKDAISFLVNEDISSNRFDSMVIVNLKAEKKIEINNVYQNLLIDEPLFYDDGSVALIFHKDKGTEMINTANGQSTFLENFDKIKIKELNIDFPLDLQRNYPLSYGKILKVVKTKDSIKLSLVDEKNRPLKVVATYNLKEDER